MSWPERLETLLQKLQPVSQSACFTAGRATASVKIEKKRSISFPPSVPSPAEDLTLVSLSHSH